MNKKLHTILINLGVTPDLLGYTYIQRAVNIEETGIKMYQKLAEEFNVPKHIPERNIRFCIQQKINIKNPIYLKIFGTTKYLTVTAFIATLRAAIKLGIIDEIYEKL